MAGKGGIDMAALDFDDAVRLADTHLARWADDDMDANASAHDLGSNLIEAVNYSLLSGGKRLRPALAILSCQAVGGSAHREAISSAIALEMIHCFSLIHDDLPAMDDDDLRRGQPTSHTQFDEATAILAGDLLATWPYRVIARDEQLPAETRATLCAELAGATSAMIAGQMYDSEGGMPAELTEPERVERIHRLKTGALVRAACRMGAIAGGANERQLAAMTTFGETIGLIFQIVDDVLDVTQSADSLGKQTGKDADAGKLTYPGVFGIEGSRDRVAQLALEAGVSLDVFDTGVVRPLRDLTMFLTDRTH